MTASDIIAITAIVASAIASIVSAYISFQNNKVNIIAKRSEVVLESRLHALEEIVKALGDLRMILLQNGLLFRQQPSPEEYQQFRNEFNLEFVKYLDTYTRLRLFFPPTVYRELIDYDKILRKHSIFSKNGGGVSQPHDQPSLSSQARFVTRMDIGGIWFVPETRSRI
jgi:hypothetical protein